MTSNIIHVQKHVCTCTLYTYAGKNGTVFATHIKNICVCLALIWVLKLCVAYEYGVHVGTGILVELLVAGDHDDSYLNVAENAQLVGFLQQSCLTFAEGDLFLEV